VANRIVVILRSITTLFYQNNFVRISSSFLLKI